MYSIYCDESCHLIKELFDQGCGTYGVDRICGLLRNDGYKAWYGRVKRFMEEMGLVSIHRSRRMLF